MKKLLLALSSVCLIPTNTLALIGCGDDKASQQQTVKNNINNFLQNSNESNKLILDKSNISKLDSFGITYQNGAYQFDNSNLTVDAIKEGLLLLINNSEQLPWIFNVQQTLLDTQAAENETALLVENQECNIFENNLIYKWNISFFITKVNDGEFVWEKIGEKSVELYAEIVDNEQVITEEVETDTANNDNKLLENNQQTAKRYKEIISKWNEDLLMLMNNKTSNTVKDLIYEIKDNVFFEDSGIKKETIENSSIKIKDVNTQNYMQETDLLVAEKYSVEVEFKIGEADSQVIETASFEIKISDHIAYQEEKPFVSKECHMFENQKDDSNSKVTSPDKFNDSGIETDQDEKERSSESDHNEHVEANSKETVSSTSADKFNDSGIETDQDEKERSSESDHNEHVEANSKETVGSTSADVATLIINVSEKTKVEEIINMIKEKYPSLLETNITLKDSKNKKVKTSDNIKFTNYHVLQDKKTLVLNLQVEELILTSTSEQISPEQIAIFNIFNDIKLDKLMTNHCSVKDLKDMIKETTQFNDLKSKIKNNKILVIKIKDKDGNEIEDKTKLLQEKYHVEILVILEENNTKANITFTMDVPLLSNELSAQLEKYVSDIEKTIAKIKTAKDSTDNKTKCKDKIKQSEEIKNIFNADKKLILEHIEILEQSSYIKGHTYRAIITFCFDKFKNASRRQVEFSFIVEYN